MVGNRDPALPTDASLRERQLHEKVEDLPSGAERERPEIDVGLLDASGVDPHDRRSHHHADGVVLDVLDSRVRSCRRQRHETFKGPSSNAVASSNSEIEEITTPVSPPSRADAVWPPCFTKRMKRVIVASRRVWRRVFARWAFQIVARTGPNESSPPGVSDFTLPAPVGVVRVSATGERPGELLFRRQGFKSEADALHAGELLKTWLQVASALHLLSLDLGHDEVRSGLGPLPRAKAEADGLQIIPDVHGLVVVRETGGRMMRFSSRSTATVTRDWNRTVTAVKEAASIVHRSLDQKSAVACAVVSTSEHRSQHELQLVGFVTAAEILADPRERTGPARQLLESMIGQADRARQATETADREAFDALCGALQGLRSESLRSAVRRLAREARPSQAATAAKLMDRAYGARSAIVHRGARVDIDLVTGFRPLIQDMVRCRTFSARADGGTTS